NLAILHAGKILGRRRIEIERARRMKIYDRRVIECRNDDAGIRPQHAAECLIPSARFAEEIGKPLLFGGAISTAAGFDMDLALQDHGMDGRSRAGRNPELESDMRRGGELKRLRRFDREVQIGCHFTLLSFNVSRNLPISFHISRPPENPFHFSRMIPMSLKHSSIGMMKCSRALPIRYASRPSTSLSMERSSGFSCSMSCHASSDSNDSTGPAGLG